MSKRSPTITYDHVRSRTCITLNSLFELVLAVKNQRKIHSKIPWNYLKWHVFEKKPRFRIQCQAHFLSLSHLFQNYVFIEKTTCSYPPGARSKKTHKTKKILQTKVASLLFRTLYFSSIFDFVFYDKQSWQRTQYNKTHPVEGIVKKSKFEKSKKPGNFGVLSSGARPWLETLSLSIIT